MILYRRPKTRWTQECVRHHEEYKISHFQWFNDLTAGDIKTKKWN